MHKWVRPLVALVILSVSVLFLSAIVDNLSPYLAVPSPREREPPERRVALTEENRISPPSQMPIKPGNLIFTVSPADPVLYWRTTTADYYSGPEWYRTTRQITTHEFPSVQESDATQFFTVELNMTEQEILLPIPPAEIDLGQPLLYPTISHEFYIDEIGETCGVRALGLGHAATIVYQAGWHYTEIDKWQVSLDDVPHEIREFYLQLPSLPVEVVQLAQKLRRPAMNIVDQILSDVAYFLLHFEYDLDYYMGRTRRTISTDWVLSYLQWGKGLCLDAATALAVILRCQGIPSRLSMGYKPTRIDGDKVLYYSNTSHAETEAYLPPYGWVRFDPTPSSPLDLPEDFGPLRPEKGLTLEISPTEAEGYPGNSVFYHLVVNNSRETKDHFELSMHSRDGWDCEITPESLLIEAFETRSALIEAKIPENASYDKADTVTVTATSTYDPNVKVSNTTIAGVRGIKRLPTVTTITYINDSVFRGDSFYAEGTVSTTDYEPVHDMCVLILFKENKEEKGGIVCGSGLSEHGLFIIEGQVPFETGLGDYAVVAISLGNTKYAPSSSDHVIEIVARTYIELDICVEDVHVTRPFLVEDHVLISGSLRLDNGTALPDTILELEVLAPGSPTTGKHQITTEHGLFLKKFMFWVPGTYELNATFLGKGHIAGSYSYRKIEVGSPLVQALTDDWCVRGEVLSISGNVSSKNDGIPEEPVTITLDGEVLATVETGPEGAFFYNWKIDSEVQPGWHLLAYTLQKRPSIGTTQYVRVMIRAQFTIDAPQEVTGEDPLTCAISLRDDHGFPIDGGEIFLGTHGLSSKTDKHGSVEFMLDTLPVWWGKMNLTASFEGSENYLPSTTFAIVTVQPGFVSVLLVLMTSLLIIGLAINRRKFKQFSQKETRGEAESEGVSVPAEKDTRQVKIGKTRVFKISFPDIRPPFPNVWGVRNRLRIECGLDRRHSKIQNGDEIELFVNNKRISKDRYSRIGPATFSYIFDKKGEHQVGARLVIRSKRQSMKDETKLRIVDYREEIIRLYRAFLQHLVNKGVDLKDEMTAREVERLLASTGDSDIENLQKVIDCFERAEYSDHEISRENYKTMYLSLEELIIDVD